MKFSDALPLAYLTDGSGLYEVVKGPLTERLGGIMAAVKRYVLIEDCRLPGPGPLLRLDENDMAKWELVKAAPVAPEHPELESF